MKEMELLKRYWEMEKDVITFLAIYQHDSNPSGLHYNGNPNDEMILAFVGVILARHIDLEKFSQEFRVHSHDSNNPLKIVTPFKLHPTKGLEWRARNLYIDLESILHFAARYLTVSTPTTLSWEEVRGMEPYSHFVTSKQSYFCGKAWIHFHGYNSKTGMVNVHTDKGGRAHEYTLEELALLLKRYKPQT